MLLTDIQRFSTRDGPGVRTTVFFKGCPLRCAWCHNPETQTSRPQLLYAASQCIGCGACVQRCPFGAHRFVQGTHDFAADHCRGCFSCVEVCPAGACTACGREYTEDEVLGILLRDLPFYGNEGGVTVSGGEPLLHSSVIGLLASCKSAGIGTAVESSGYVDGDILLRTAAYTDLFLYDCKDTDVSRHKAYTGVDPTLIFENLRALDALGTSRIRLRCILVSGVNTEETHYAAIVALYRSLHHCEGVEFLPYHPYGSSKSVQLGGTDTAHRAWIPTADVIDGAKSFLRKAGVPVLCE